MAGAIHNEHRKRMRERFAKEGLDGMNDHEVLELLLFHALPRVDTNPIAHRLLNAFGSFHAVLEAPTHELAQVEGMGEGSARFLHLLRQTARRYQIDCSEDQLRGAGLTTTEMVGAYLAPQFFGLTEERSMLLCMDSKCKVLSCTELTRGTVRANEVNIRKIVEQTMRMNASAVVLAHNHPNGLALPSREDMQTTQRIADALKLIGIGLRDHIIVAGDDFVSMADSGLLNY